MPLPRQRLSYSAIVDQFERLYQERATIIRIMAISLHPYITGVAHRIGHDGMSRRALAGEGGSHA